MQRSTSLSKVAPSYRTSSHTRWLAVVFAALGIAATGRAALAQSTGAITGRVTEAGTAQPLAASIRVTGTQIGAQTSPDGRYTIRGVAPGTVDLQVSHIGYEAKHVSVTVTAGGTATADVVLTQAPFSLAAVVTTVTGVQSKAEISNTVASIDVASQIAEAPISTAGELLSGRAAGVQVLSSGAVGSGSRIRIRGASSLSLSNDPIVYVDGVRVDAKTGDSGIGTGGTQASAFDNINPAEIETIDVIKGPAAATLIRHAGGQRRHRRHDEARPCGRHTVSSVVGERHAQRSRTRAAIRISGCRSIAAPASRRARWSSRQSGSCLIDSTYHGNVLNDPTRSRRCRPAIARSTAFRSPAAPSAFSISSRASRSTRRARTRCPASRSSGSCTERGSTIGADQVYPNVEKKVNLRTNLNAQLTTQV